LVGTPPTPFNAQSLHCHAHISCWMHSLSQKPQQCRVLSHRAACFLFLHLQMNYALFYFMYLYLTLTYSIPLFLLQLELPFFFVVCRILTYKFVTGKLMMNAGFKLSWDFSLLFIFIFPVWGKLLDIFFECNFHFFWIRFSAGRLLLCIGAVITNHSLNWIELHLQLMSWK